MVLWLSIPLGNVTKSLIWNLPSSSMTRKIHGPLQLSLSSLIGHTFLQLLENTQISHLWPFAHTGFHHQLPTHIHHFSLIPLDQRDPCLRGHEMSICCALAKHLLNSMKYIPSCPKSVLCLRLPALGDQGQWVPCLHHWIIGIQHRIWYTTGTRMKEWVKCDCISWCMWGLMRD